MNNENPDNKFTDAHLKKERDRFFIILAGIIGYAVILIAIVIVTFFATKNSFVKKDEEVRLRVEKESDTASEPEAGEVSSNVIPQESEEAVEDEEIADHSVEESRYMDPEGRLDYTKTLFTPGKRDEDLGWVDAVFGKLENVKEPQKALVNTYDMHRKNVILSDDKLQDFFIFTEPGTSRIEKITTVEHCSDDVEVIDFYYDRGSINYVAQRTTGIEYPIDISSGKVKSRYYFNQDTLVKYSYCEDDKATVFTAADLDEYSEGTVGQYEHLEAEMVNRAYIVYNAASTLPEAQLIEGYVLDEYDQALADVDLRLINSQDMTEITYAITDGDGHYSMSIPVNEEASYYISVRKDEFDETRIYGITSREGSGTYFVPTPRLTYSSDGAEYNEIISVRDCDDGGIPLSDASIKLRAGLNCREGDVIASSVLDAGGNAAFTIQSGNYTAQVSKDGYLDSFFNVIVTMGRQVTAGYAVKNPGDNVLKVILSWDTMPLDLDSRLIGAGGSEVIRPLNDSLGAVNAETITFAPADNGLYRYYVSDLSDINAGDVKSANMTESGAYVSVYGSEGLIESYCVPAGHLGVIWEAFDIRRNRVIPVNTYYDTIGTDGFFAVK